MGYHPIPASPHAEESTRDLTAGHTTDPAKIAAQRPRTVDENPATLDTRDHLHGHTWAYFSSVDASATDLSPRHQPGSLSLPQLRSTNRWYQTCIQPADHRPKNLVQQMQKESFCETLAMCLRATMAHMPNPLARARSPQSIPTE